MTYQDASLGDFVRQLAVRFARQGTPMPLKNERPWHELFYDLQQQGSKPAFLESMKFDWNGPYPTSRALSEYLSALHWTGCVSAGNPSYDEISLAPDVQALWEGEQVEAQLGEYLDRVVHQAQP